MSNQGNLYDDLEKAVAKLCVLRDSCTGILHTDKESPNLIWFQGAEAILREAVDELQETLHSMERGEADLSAGSADAEKESVTGEDE